MARNQKRTARDFATDIAVDLAQQHVVGAGLDEVRPGRKGPFGDPLHVFVAFALANPEFHRRAYFFSSLVSCLAPGASAADPPGAAGCFAAGGTDGLPASLSCASTVVFFLSAAQATPAT